MLAILIILCSGVQAATVSITATNNGKTVSVNHYYGAVNASYKAEGKGKVSYESVDVSEDFKASGEANQGQGESNVTVNHLAIGNDYAIASVHEIYAGKMSESGSINAGENGRISKDVSDEGYAESVMVAAKKNVKVDKKVGELDIDDLDWFLPEDRAIAGADNAIAAYNITGKANGEQSVATGSASASQSLEMSGDFHAFTKADEDSNGNGKTSEWVKSLVDGSGQINVTQSATTSTCSSSQRLNAVGNGSLFFTSTAAKDTNYDYNINEYAQAGNYDVGGFDRMYDRGDWYYVSYYGTVNAETSATTSNSVLASMDVNASGNIYIPMYLGLMAAKDNNDDGNIDEKANTWVYVYEGFPHQFNADGWAKVKDTGNREESYMNGYENGGVLYGYAVANSEKEETYIGNNFLLHAWIDENGNANAEAETSP